MKNEKPLEELLDLLIDLQLLGKKDASVAPSNSLGSKNLKAEGDSSIQTFEKPAKSDSPTIQNGEKSPSQIIINIGAQALRPQADLLPQADLPPQQVRGNHEVIAPTENVPPPAKKKDEERQILAHLAEKVAHLERQVYQPTDLIDPLLPLIGELLHLKVTESQEAIIQAVLPVIDEVIRQKSQQDCRKMSGALAPLLPAAISQEIQASPQEIARAIAPEVASAIEEQIHLDPDAIPRTLGPEMGRAIKTQIEVERDAMVDALYPVIGNTISKYMAELVKSVNEKVETALSPAGIQRKIRAKLQGVSEAELILRESLGFSVVAIFLIQKASGLIIAEVQPSPSLQLESDMLAALLTAIRSFANDCISQPDSVSELREIDWDGSKILLEVAGYCYLATVIQGEPTKPFVQKLRDTLGQIVLNYSRAIKEFEGDRSTVPSGLQQLLDRSIEPETAEKTAKRPTALLLLLFALACAILVPWGILQYRSRTETDIANALDAAPELSVYRILPHAHQGKLTLSGRVPNSYLRDRAGQIALKIAPNLELDNQIIAVELPPDPILTAAEVQRVTALFNQREGVAISSRHQGDAVTIKGIVPNQEEAEKITWGFRQIPGVRSVTNTVQVGLTTLKTRIYFDFNSTELKEKEIKVKIQQVKEFLRQNPKVHLKIIGHSDPVGDMPGKGKLALGRARAVQQALILQGVSSGHLQVSGSPQLPPDVTAGQPSWLSRCVRFEILIH